MPCIVCGGGRRAWRLSHPPCTIACRIRASRVGLGVRPAATRVRERRFAALSGIFTPSIGMSRGGDSLLEGHGNTFVAESARIQLDFRSRAEFLRIQLRSRKPVPAPVLEIRRGATKHCPAPPLPPDRMGRSGRIGWRTTPSDPGRGKAFFHDNSPGASIPWSAAGKASGGKRRFC